MANFYFTFAVTSPNADCYMQVEAPTMWEAREYMADMYGLPLVFAFCYEEVDFLPQIEKYGLWPIPFGMAL